MNITRLFLVLCNSQCHPEKMGVIPTFWRGKLSPNCLPKIALADGTVPTGIKELCPGWTVLSASVPALHGNLGLDCVLRSLCQRLDQQHWPPSSLISSETLPRIAIHLHEPSRSRGILKSPISMAHTNGRGPISYLTGASHCPEELLLPGMAGSQSQTWTGKQRTGLTWT